MDTRLARPISALLAVAALAGCTDSGSSPPDRDTVASDTTALAATQEDKTGGRFAFGRSVDGLEVVLARDVGSAVGSGSAPFASSGLGGVLYVGLTSARGQPTTSELRLVRDGMDQALLPGVESFAIDDLGTIAAARPTADGQSEVVLLSEPGVEPKVLATTDAHFVVVGWAGRYLMVSEGYGDSGQIPRALRMDAEGNTATLAKDSGVAAISPDGTRLLLDSIGPDGSNVSVIVDVETGDPVGKVDLTSAPNGLLLGQASWTDAGVVAAGFVDAKPYALQLTVVGDDLVVAHTIALPDGLMSGLNEPFLSADGLSIQGWSVDAKQNIANSIYLAVTCNVQVLSCTTAAIGLPGLPVGRVRTSSRGAGWVGTVPAEQA